MKTLSVLGTAAMFLVGGAILVHGLPAVHHFIEPLVHAAGGAGTFVGMLAEAVVGIVAGALALLLVMAVKRLVGGLRRQRAT